MSTLAAIPIAAQERVEIGLAVECMPQSETTFLATGTRQSYEVDAGAEAVFIRVGGASGGDALAKGERGIYVGGLGADLSVLAPVVGGQMLDVIVGERGVDGGGDLNRGDDDVEPARGDGGGGGGGSFVSLASSQILLAAAGGGGGGGITQDGKDASTGEDGVSSDAPCEGLGGTNGNGGQASTSQACGDERGFGDFNDAGGGGGWLSAGGDGETAQGGDQVSPPGTAAGGLGVVSNHGGFGGGGGGSGPGGGGGGGYSGGGGGYGPDTDGGGGGGSFAAANALLLDSGILEVTGDGLVQVCSVAEFSGGGLSVLQVPAGGPWAKAGLIALLALVAVLALRRFV